MPIIWQKPNGSILISQLEEGYLARNRVPIDVDTPYETVEEAVLRLAEVLKQKDPALKDLEPVLVKSAEMPMDRSKRYAWRLRTIDGVPKVIVDMNVPAPPLSPAEQGRAELLALDPKAIKPEDLPSIVERLQKVL